MAQNPLQEFEKTVFNEDHEEALRINELFDQQTDPEFALDLALDMAEEEFTENQASKAGFAWVETTGYTTYKNARRWMNHAIAYLETRRTAGGSEDKPLPADQVADYSEQEFQIGQQVKAGNSFYTRTFDQAERERVHRERSGQPAVNPFEQARAYGALMLASTIDRFIEDMEDYDPSADEHDYSVSVEGGLNPSTYLVKKASNDLATMYTIAVFSEDQEQLERNENDQLLADTMYGLTERGQGEIVINGQSRRTGHAPTDAHVLLSLANTLSSDEYLQESAIARVEMVLNQRRQAEVDSLRA